MSETNAQLIERFVSEFPGLQGALTEHLADNHGELLPHVFLLDVVRYATELFVRQSNATDDALIATQHAPSCKRCLKSLKTNISTEAKTLGNS